MIGELMRVTVAVVAYNEEGTLPAVLADIGAQDYPREKTEILLIDSASTDGTRAIMDDFAAKADGYFSVKVLENEKKTLPCGCNVMLDNYSGDAVVRIDAHASIPADFISKNVALLNSGEDVCGGARPNVIDGETPWRRTLLAAEQSMFGSGFASYRNCQRKCYTSSIFHGFYRRAVYDKVGRYNEDLARTEDNDMSYRIRRAGYKICYDPDIISYQHTRSTLGKMLRQKYLNGLWIGRTLGVTPGCISLFHLVPLAFVIAIIATTVLSLFGIWQLSALMWGMYALVVLAMTAFELVSGGFSLTKLALPVLFLLLHLSYGAGSVVGVCSLPFWLRKIKK